MNTRTRVETLNEKLRTEARQNLLDALAGGLVEWALDQGLFRSCLNCANWNGEQAPGVKLVHKPETCRLNGLRPPARIIVTGCECHSDNIPF